MSSATDRALSAECCADPEDVAWGRVPGADPPIRWQVPVIVFLIAALLLALVIVFVVKSPGQLDDPDPANQRAGLLLNGPALPVQVAGVSFGDHPVIVLFERTPPTGKAFQQWSQTVSDDDVQLVVVVTGSQQASVLAAAVNMPIPVDGGPPVGYAVIDANRVVRYATLDPVYTRNSFEVDVITGTIS